MTDSSERFSFRWKRVGWGSRPALTHLAMVRVMTPMRLASSRVPTALRTGTAATAELMVRLLLLVRPVRFRRRSAHLFYQPSLRLGSLRARHGARRRSFSVQHGQVVLAGGRQGLVGANLPRVDAAQAEAAEQGLQGTSKPPGRWRSALVV